MYELLEELWLLKRDIISDDYDRALFRLAEEIPMQIHQYSTGKQVWTWHIPEKWTCKQAYIETLDGQRILDYEDHPLHVVSYSLPINRDVTKEELLAHLHVHPTRPEAIPYVFKYYERDWGFCATQHLRDSLTHSQYQVVIDTTFEPGTLKVGEIVIRGASEKTFVLAAHLCHPAMANDDLSGVVVAVDVAQHLLQGPQPNYTYRILILPETIGSVAYLSQNEELIPDMIGGLFLEMLGNDSGHALQGSFQPDSQVDRCLNTAFKSLDPLGYTSAYRSIIDNDERQFNGPGVRVPMLSLSRVEAPKTIGKPPYPEYHSSQDTLEIIVPKRLEASRDLVMGLLDTWEKNQYILNLFKGEVFCSGYGIWIDYRVNPEGHRNLFQIMDRCDGERTIADIAYELKLSFQSVWEVVQMLSENDLIRLLWQPQPTTPQRKSIAPE
jgi:aminopeptidase-like protein